MERPPPERSWGGQAGEGRVRYLDDPHDDVVGGDRVHLGGAHVGLVRLGRFFVTIIMV